MERGKMELYFVCATTTIVRHYEVLAKNAEEARDMVDIDPEGTEPVATDIQTIIDFVERNEEIE